MIERPIIRCLICGLEGMAHEVTCTQCLRDHKALNFDVEAVSEAPIGWHCPEIKKRTIN